MTAMLLRLQPYYTVRPAADGRWLVVHALPGQPGAFAADADCPSLAAAEREAAWLEDERQRHLMRARHERQLLGLSS